MPELRKNDVITLDITDLNNLGYGVGRYEGTVVFVRGAISGERVRARLIKINKSYCVARLDGLVTRSPRRLESGVCDAPEGCGGCVYRHIDYAYELELKRGTVISAFRHAGLDDVTVGEVRSTGRIRGYRNKAMFPVGRMPDGALRAGLYASKSHTISGGSDCMLQSDGFGMIADEVCRLCTLYGITAYDERTGDGILRHIYLRRGEMTGQVMLCLVINSDVLPSSDAICDALTDRFPEICGILINVNKKNTNVVLGERFLTLRGNPYIEDILCGKRFRIAPDSFYQVNREGAELLYSIAGELAGKHPDGTLLDLYCGAGTIGLSLSENFGRLIGIEIVPSAVECARFNAVSNGITNAYFTCGDASDADGLLGRAEREMGERIEADVVVLDPPRKGCSPELIDYIAGRRIGNVVYVSCDPMTLARDCALFRSHGYLIGNVTPVDMFPRTGHVESVVKLKLM